MKVILHVENNPEDNAMLQALYSRSPKSVTEHLEKLRTVGSGKFMEQFYLGYGHASIADCGFTTIYFEGISMLAAKAIEDNPLFNGQESSSRYIDFSKQYFLNPYACNTEQFMLAQHCLDELRAFYVRNLQPTRDHLKTRFPNEGGVSDSAYEKTINAKAFDILRGYLPAGATTNVAWTTSLRKAHENLVLLMHHPLEELQHIARTTYARLYATYPHSFKKEYAELDNQKDPNLTLIKLEGDEVFNWRSEFHHFYAAQPCEKSESGYQILSPSGLTATPLGQFAPFSEGTVSRPRKESLTRHSGGAESVLKMELTLDFGSFRDLQRHRGGYCSNPVLNSENGFHAWYFENLSEQSKADAKALLQDLGAVSDAILSASEDPSYEKLQLQYITPMGVLVPVTLVYSLPQTIYVAELRSGKTVHPTLRPVAQEMALYLEGQGVPVYADMDESDWTLRRGTQDIVQK